MPFKSSKACLYGILGTESHSQLRYSLAVFHIRLGPFLVTECNSVSKYKSLKIGVIMKRNIAPFINTEERFIRKAAAERDLVETKFPLIFGLLITFGFVSTLYGFEKLIDRVDLFIENPWILLGMGVTTLILTGAAYKKLN
jgi:hypothetical protein